MGKLVELQGQLEAAIKAQAALLDEHGDDLPAEKQAEVEARDAEITGVITEIKRLQGLEEKRQAVAEAERFLKEPAGHFPHPGSRGAGGLVVPERKSAGQLFVEHPDYREWYGRVAPSGHMSDKKQFDSPSIPLPGGVKTLVTGASDTSGGALVFNDVQPGIVPLPFRPLTLRDIITVGQTNSDTIEYVRVTGYTNAAAAVAEATAATGTSGTKPESALTLAKAMAPVRTIAHWIPATTRALSDAPQLRTLIDTFLRDGLEQVLEDEILTGDGSGEHFDGVGHISGTQSQAWDTDALTTLRKARTLVRVVGRAVPTAFVMHPNDWQTIDLLQDNEARYFFGGPREIQGPRVWGLPVVECEACPEGTAYVGDWRTVVLFDREQASIQVSNSHSDFFVRNLIAILAEMRAALAILRPAALVEIDLTA